MRYAALIVLLPAVLTAACGGNARLLPYAGTHGYKVVLDNNPAAVDPTWQQVKDFLAADKTDERDYVPGDFVCSSFAQDVHNNAEKAGIRAAWVAIDLEGKPIGHALNAFDTTDRGLVFTDSTGDTEEANMAAVLRPELEEGSGLPAGSPRDRAAYVVKGRELGFISIDLAQSPEYSYYEQYKIRRNSYMKLLEEYNSKVDACNEDIQAFNSWAGGRSFIAGSADAARYAQWRSSLEMARYLLDDEEKTLDKAKTELGPVWKPMGTAANLDIRW